MSKNSKSVIPYLVPVIFLALIAGVVIFLLFAMQGEVKTFGDVTENETSESVTCTVGNLDYPFFEYDDTTSKSTKINMIFKKDKLATINLIQEMRYNDSESANKSEILNHISMNKSFGSTYGADAFNADYYVDNTKMRLSLYTEANKLNEDAKKYFLATGTTNTKKVLIKNYETQGFTCNNK